jgi:hypothetical protein
LLPSAIPRRAPDAGSFEEGEAIATEMSTDFVTVTNGHGFSAIDRRIPAGLPAALGFGKQIVKLAERWRALRGKI